MIGSQSLMLVLGVVLLLFGGKKLPELAGSLGKSMKEFKKAVETEHETPAPETQPVLAAPAARACAACQATLEVGWTHCPRCGTPAPQPSAVTS